MVPCFSYFYWISGVDYEAVDERFEQSGSTLGPFWDFFAFCLLYFCYGYSTPESKCSKTRFLVSRVSGFRDRSTSRETEHFEPKWIHMAQVRAVQLAEGGMNDPPHPNKSPTDSGPRGPTCRRVIWVWNQGTAMSQQSQFCAVSLVLYRIENDIHSNDHELFILFLSLSSVQTIGHMVLYTMTPCSPWPNSETSFHCGSKRFR